MLTSVCDCGREPEKMVRVTKGMSEGLPINFALAHFILSEGPCGFTSSEPTTSLPFLIKLNSTITCISSEASVKHGWVGDGGPASGHV